MNRNVLDLYMHPGQTNDQIPSVLTKKLHVLQHQQFRLDIHPHAQRAPAAVIGGLPTEVLGQGS